MLPLIYINVKIDNLSAKALYDPGSNVTVLMYHTLERFKIELNEKNFRYRTMSGTSNFIGTATINLKIFDITKSIQVYVYDDKSRNHDILLGLDTIYLFQLIQDENLKISSALLKEKFSKEFISCPEPEKINPISENLVNWNEAIPIEQFDAKVEHLNPQKRKIIYDLIDEYDSLFAKDSYDVGTVSNHEATITLSEMKYTAKRPYRCSYEDQQEIEKQITELLNNNMIEQSSSPFAAPVTLAFKKTEEGKPKEKIRMCIDFRDLNKLLVPESQPFPLIEDMIVRTRDCSWFSALDINSAFWSVPIRVKDRFKTGFVTQQGHWQWRNMPFGLKNSPAIFQRILSGVIRKHNLQSFCVNYIDDILIFSKSFMEHVEHLRLLFNAIQEEGWKLKFLKCKFASSSVSYLGHIVENNTVRPLRDNLISIKAFPRPKNRRNIRQFLGKINFYHKYIPESAKKLECFHNLLRKDVAFEWSEECERRFNEIKEYLTSSPILAVFDPNLPISIYTDASGEGVAGILKQVQSDGLEKPVAYFSKKLNDAQKRKKAIYIESYAVREAIRYWRFWLIGRHFKVYTDHKPLENLNLKSRPDEELGDIANYLLQFDFEIIYRPGSSNSEADCLSRNPVLPEDSEDCDKDLQTVNYLSLDQIKSIQSVLPLSPQDFQKDGMIIRNIRGKNKIFLPQKNGIELLEKVHADLGHVGASILYNTLKNDYFFPKMYILALKVSRSCETCLRNKTRRKIETSTLGHFGPATRPFQIMSLDTVGGFNDSRSNHRYLHLLIDNFTRYAYILTSQNQNTKTFVKLIKSALKDFKFETLLSDQYGGLSSKDFHEFLKENNISHCFTAVDHPSSHGIVERLNQTLVNRMRCKGYEKGANASWTRIACDCASEYNRTIHSSTGFAPEYLAFGKKEEISPLPHVSSYDHDLRTAFSNSQRSHMRNKERLDKGKEEIVFDEGDMIFIDNGNKLNREKMDPVRIGPFKIEKKISNSIYEIKVGRKGKRDTRFYHVSKMIKA